MLNMETPADRVAWIEGVIDGRTSIDGKSIWAHPNLSIADVARREACAAFVAELYLSSVLAAYAACEIGLMDIIIAKTALINAGGDMTPESWDQAWSEAVVGSGRLGRTQIILDRCTAVGHQVVPELRTRILELGAHKNDLAHYRPASLFDLRATSQTSVMGTLNPAPPVDPARRRHYAEHGVRTMLDLWFAPMVSLPAPPGGNPPIPR